jgi:signal transduction histidine kinase/ligand-binding sensor domain-containing protein/DNA-binding response OmpR family regulator
MKFFVKFTVLLLVCSDFLFAQTTKFYSTEGGLSNSLINQVYQDKKGFIWIATENGLNKFDGNKFIVYKKIQGDSTSLKNNYVRTLFEDNSGNFWIGCIDGLMRYDRNFDTFREIEIHNEHKQRLYPHITSIIERNNGDIWISSSGSGLFSIKKGEMICRMEKSLSERLCSRFLTVIYEDSNNRIWIGSENSGLNIYMPDKDELYTYTVSSGGNKSITSNAISAICENDNGDIFIGTLNGGINKFDQQNQSVTFIHDRNGNKRLPVKTLIVDHSKQLLVGTDGLGMKKYNPNEQTLETYEPFFIPFDFSKVKIHSLCEDKDGNIWAGIFQKGVFFIPGNPNGFKYYGYKSFRENNIGFNCVMAIYKDKDELVWIGTDNDGLYALNEKTQQVRHYRHDDNLASVPSSIMCFHEGGDKLWMGSYLNGLALFDKKTGKMLPIHPNLKNTLANSKVYCMTSDKKGKLYIGTYGNGLYKINLSTQSIETRYYQYHEGDEGLANNWINSLVYDNGLLWIATYNGLSCLDTQTEIFYNYRTENSDLPNNIIFALKKDQSENIWIGTNEGLACLNKKINKIKSFVTGNGLPNNVICSIEDDLNGNIWLTTLSGISKYSPKEQEFTNFYASDGLQGIEFSRGAHCKSEETEIFFGGTNGIIRFIPNEIHKRKKISNVYITDFYLFEKRVHKNQKSEGKNILDQLILDAGQISLSADDNVFSFDFSTLEYDNPEGISYRYRLENFDANWITTPQGNNRAAYSNVRPGKYVFYYQAGNKENESEIRSIKIFIRSPWYLSTWAKSIYVIFFLLVTWGIYRFIKSRIKQKNEMLRLEHADQISEAKLQFFINVSHEIRTPMTLIIGPLEKLLKENENPALQNSYRLIYRNAQRILRLINQLMDIRKIDRGQMQLKARETDMVEFIKNIMQSFEYSAKRKNIDFEFKHKMEILNVWVDRDNFDKVLFNVFSNAFKFTPDQGKIIVELIVESDRSIKGALRNYYEIKVSDTGIGIDEEKIEKIFERFYQINSEINHSNFGTGIGLHLARSLVELQHGTIHAKNRTDTKGTCIVIRMPVGNAHLKKEEKETVSEQISPLATSYSKNNLLDIEIGTKEESATEVKAKTKYSILVVEDDKEISNYIYSELAPYYKIKQTSNGKEALEIILTEKPHLVVSDIMMSQMDGITLCRKVKSNVNTNHIPVLLLTAKSKEEDLLEGLDTGADAYMVKPFNPEILKKTVANLLKNRERLKGRFQIQSEGKLDKIEIKSADELLMERVLKVINKNIDNSELNVKMLSSSVGISRVHLHRKLKELTNLSASDFVRNIRLKQAGELLQSKKLSITEVAYAVGFTSLSHFSNCFKDFYGKSPSEYAADF